MSWPRRLALLVWELPQNLVGAALLAASRLCGDVHSLAIEHDRIFVRSRTLGISLGLFVFYSEGDNRYFPPDPLMKRHEHGHTFQSRLLGPLYLPLVGVPSSLRALHAVLYREVTGRRWTGYFDGYPERWADALGGISREERAAVMAHQAASSSESRA